MGQNQEILTEEQPSIEEISNHVDIGKAVNELIVESGYPLPKEIVPEKPKTFSVSAEDAKQRVFREAEKNKILSTEDELKERINSTDHNRERIIAEQAGVIRENLGNKKDIIIPARPKTSFSDRSLEEKGFFDEFLEDNK
ncbi:MAG: hypothetical protein WC415_03485 [Patescibacteria group bacterium]|jgi:hypothetical protein